MRSLDIAGTGMQAQQTNVEVISNNIANMTTTGFKRRRAEFQDLLYQNLRRVGSNTSQTVGTLQIATFANEAGLEAQGENLFLASGASGNPVTGTPASAGFGSVMQGFVETSNVNVVTEITNLITAQRAYEMNSKVI